MHQQIGIQHIDFAKEKGDDEAQVVAKDLRKPVQDTSVHPYNGIGRIITRLYDFENKENIQQSGTAFIMGKNLIVTAAHVLKFKKLKALCDDIEFFPQQLLRGKQAAKKGINARIIHIRKDFLDLGEEINKKFDFVFLQLQENNIITEDQVLSLDFNYKFKKSDIFNISGYGGAGIYGNIQAYEQNLAAGQKDNFLLYKHSTDGGNSGGPVLLKKDEGKYVVVGIHKGSISQHNYCLLLRTLNSPEVNNSSIKLSQLSAKNLEQNWPQTYIKSYRQKDKTYAQIKQQNKELTQKLLKIQFNMNQKQLQILSLKSQIKQLQSLILKITKKTQIKPAININLGLNNLQENWSTNLLKQSQILNKEGLELLRQWLIKPIEKIQLKFKLSNNAYRIDSFFKKCQQKENLIIMIKTKKGKILGGYTPLSFYPFNQKKNKWTSKQKFQLIKDESNTSFLFSLTQKSKFQLNKTLKYAIQRWKDKRQINFNNILIINDYSNIKANNFYLKIYQQQIILFKNYRIVKSCVFNVIDGSISGGFCLNE